VYSCHGRTTSFSVKFLRCARKLPSGGRNCQIQAAETTNDSALNRNAQSYPNCMALIPPMNAPIVNVLHCVVWVSEFAVCSSS
jgi:hypothetical protein